MPCDTDYVPVSGAAAAASPSNRRARLTASRSPKGRGAAPSGLRARCLAAVLLQQRSDGLAQELGASAPGLIRQPREVRGLLIPQAQRRLDAVLFDPLIQFAITAREVVVHLALTQPIVVEIIQTGVREPRVERAQLREIER